MNAQQKTIRFSWKILLGWSLANLIGFVVAGAVLFSLAYFLSGGFGAPGPPPVKVNYLKLFITELFFGGVAGSIVGVCQAFVIMPYLKNASIWIFATATGFALGMASDIFLPPDVHLSWALTGLLIGLFQWMVLRKEVQNAWLWILINFVIGITLELLGGWNWGVILFPYLGVGNIFTGIILAWLIPNQKKVEGA